MTKLRLVFASALAAVITTVFVVVITILAELSAPLKDWLKNFSGHHWTSKSIFSVLLYAVANVILYFVFRGSNDIRIRNTLVFLLISIALGTIIIMAFYTGHNFNIF